MFFLGRQQQQGGGNPVDKKRHAHVSNME